MEDKALHVGVADLGEPSLFTCPECHGILLRLKAGGGLRFRCHTGHAYTADALLAELTESVEGCSGTPSARCRRARS
jgi:two-component system, chemotaxis family, protein-glutamate methylesterase/glutaminase